MFANATRRAHCLSLISASVVPERRRAVAASTLVPARKTFRPRAAIRAAGLDAFSVAMKGWRLHVACTMCCAAVRAFLARWGARFNERL